MTLRFSRLATKSVFEPRFKLFGGANPAIPLPSLLNLGLEAAVDSILLALFWCLRFCGPKLLKEADLGLAS